MPRRSATDSGDCISFRPSAVALTDVHDVVGAQRLAQDVLHAGQLQDGTGSAAGDNAGTGNSRLDKNTTGTELADDLMRQRLLVGQRHGEHVLLCVLHAL